MTELDAPIRIQLQYSSHERIEEVARVLVASSVRNLDWTDLEISGFTDSLAVLLCG